MPSGISIKNIKKVLREPIKIQNAVEKVLSKIHFYTKYGAGVDVMAKDWDFLIILDACRYDKFKEISWIDGDLGYEMSKGSHSVDFLRENFENKQFHDTIYVTANGYGARIAEGVFHNMIFTDENVDSNNFPHSNAKGLAPDTVYNATIDAIEEYPDKRIIVHFMQPHSPYFGEKAEKLRERVKQNGLKVKSCELEEDGGSPEDSEEVVNTLKQAARRGYVSASEIEEVYTENLKLVLEYVERLVSEVEGKVVITADHGDCLGEHGIIGHGKGLYYEELRKVPWLTIDSEDRPNIMKTEPENHTEISKNAVEKRLRNLGYK